MFGLNNKKTHVCECGFQTGSLPSATLHTGNHECMCEYMRLFVVQYYRGICFVPEVLIRAESVLASVAKLPCDLSTPLPHDFVTLVIWYKNEAKSPIYR